ncbi:MAG TPA: DNA-directed RNA polymerase subunit alpha [Candidatus Paceibacterota bacterium]
MPNIHVILPSKPKVLSEKDNTGVYEIENLYPGYGYTLGNSLRRIILSSLPGGAITSVKIDGVSHEFSTIAGVKEDVITILLNLKKVRFRMSTDEPQKARIHISGIKEVSATNIETSGQVEVVNTKQHIAEITDKGVTFDVEMIIEKGIGYTPKEILHKDKVEIGSIALDATFTSIKRVNYEVENMRVGDRTDFNRLRIYIETDGVTTPREALETSISIMINQLRAIVGFQEESLDKDTSEHGDNLDNSVAGKEASKMKIEELELSSRTANALTRGGIRTVGGLSRKSGEDLLAIEGLGTKALDEIRDALVKYGLNLKS